MSDTAATASAPAADTTAAAPSFAVGNLVSHSWTDQQDEEFTRYGIVVALVPATDNGAARVSVGWLEGPHPLPPELLAGVGA